MKIIEVKSIPVACLKDHPENNFIINQATINALVLDMKKNGQKESIKVIVDPDEPESYLVVNGRHRKYASIINGEPMAECLIVEYNDKFELIEDILSHSICREKSEFDKAMEFDKRRTVLNRKSGVRTDLSKEEKGKTNDIIAKRHSGKISGDQVGKYLIIYDNYRGLFDLVQRDILSIGSAANVISLMLDEERDFNESTIREIADLVYFEVNSEEYPEIEKLSVEEVEALLSKYAKKLSGFKRTIVEAKKANPKPTEPAPVKDTDGKEPGSATKAPENNKDDVKPEKEAEPKIDDSSAPSAPVKMLAQQGEPKQLYFKNSAGAYEEYTCTCANCPNNCSMSK